MTSWVTDSIQSSHVRVGGGGALERDLALYDRKAAQYLSNLANNASKDLPKDPNDNTEQSPTVLHVEDPLFYWQEQVIIRYSLTMK